MTTITGKRTFISLLSFGIAFGLAACGGGQDEEIQALSQRIQGLEKETETLGKELKKAERARARAEKEARQAIDRAEPSGSDSIVYERTCGILPGDGYYSYVKVKGIDCESAEAIALAAQETFCSSRDMCRLPNDSAPALEGVIDFDGWSCKITDGWELSEVSCVQGDQALLRASGA